MRVRRLWAFPEEREIAKTRRSLGATLLLRDDQALSNSQILQGWVRSAMKTKAKRWVKLDVNRVLIAMVIVVAGGMASELRAQQASGNSAAQVGPFPPLPPAQQAQLDQILLEWQKQSQSTKTLECNFTRWHYDLMAAPENVHAHKARGVVKYASPDKGVFKVDSMLFFKGMEGGKPTYGPIPNKFGEWWVCNGVELIEYDRDSEECTVTRLPPEMQGKQIFNSPLPFVFNLDAEQIKQRYFLNLKPSPKPNTYLIEAFPKLQADRAQYKMVQVVLNANFEPDTLLMYAPNFHPKLAPQWDHYEFADTKRNKITARLQQLFMNNFIPKKPPASWTIKQEVLPPAQVAGQSGETQNR